MALIKLTIYNAESEPVKDVATSLIPWGIMKRAIRLAKSMGGLAGKDETSILEAMSDEDIDNLTQLVVDVFGGRVTVKELEQGAEVTEMLAVLTAVVTKAFGASANPTPPGN